MWPTRIKRLGLNLSVEYGVPLAVKAGAGQCAGFGDFMYRSINEECGVFGIYYPSYESNVAKSVYYALYALQHRGQESSGIAVNDDGIIKLEKNIGLVHEVFTAPVLNRLGGGSMAIGHVRSSAAGETTQVSYAQPMLVHHVKGSMAIAHNGKLTNANELREALELSGAIFQTTGDAEVISYAVTRARLEEDSVEKAVEKAMTTLSGAYSMIIMSPRKLIAARDPNGFRPLCMGRLGDAVIFASESCALGSIGAEFVRDIEPGEIVVMGPDGLKSIKTHCKGKNHICVFEYVYFARPDSIIEGRSVHMARRQAGAILAADYPVEADVVIGVPDSGLDAAMGYAEASGIPYGVGFIKNRYIGRTFIQPSQGTRRRSVRIKLNALLPAVKGKRVIMVDDSIVRGTTCARIVNLLRESGATEVHMRVSSPPFMHPCFFGTDIPDRVTLMAHNRTLEEIRQIIGVDSLDYLDISDLPETVKGIKVGFCDSCFTGDYAVEVPDTLNKDILEGRSNE